MTDTTDYRVKTLADNIGKTFGPSAPVVLSQDDINGFAEITGDRQWIHVDVERAKTESPYKTTIAHGFLTLSLLAAAVGSAGAMPSDAQAVLNYGLEKVRFLAPVPSGAAVQASFTLSAVEDKGPGKQLVRFEAVLTVEGNDKPAVIAELLALVMG